MTDLREPVYGDLEPEARALVDGWVAQLAIEPDEVVAIFRFLVGLVAVKRGELREVQRTERDGEPIVVLVDPHQEIFYWLKDPRLGEAEAALVAEMERVLGG